LKRENVKKVKIIKEAELVLVRMKTFNLHVTGIRETVEKLKGESKINIAKNLRISLHIQLKDLDQLVCFCGSCKKMVYRNYCTHIKCNVCKNPVCIECSAQCKYCSIGECEWDVCKSCIKEGKINEDPELRRCRCCREIGCNNCVNNCDGCNSNICSRCVDTDCEKCSSSFCKRCNPNEYDCPRCSEKTKF